MVVGFICGVDMAVFYSFYCWVVFSSMAAPNLFIRLSTDKHLVCFQLGRITNKAEHLRTSLGVDVCFRFSWGNAWRRNGWIICRRMPHFLRNNQTVLQRGCTIYIPISHIGGFQFLRLSLTFGMTRLFHFRHFYGSVVDCGLFLFNFSSY